MFRRLADARRVRAATNQILARIMEFRLFVDEPALVWRAQKEALRANLALLREIALPCLIMAGCWFRPHLWSPNPWACGPLRVGEVTVMTGAHGQYPAD